MKYNTNHCNIPGCTHDIYRNYMCKEHYDFYLTNYKCQKISNNVIAVYEGRASLKQKFLAFRDDFIHHAFDFPMIRYEHFPLEHIFLLALRYFDKHDKERCSRVMEDFDIPENENIAMFKRFVNVYNINETDIKPLEFYLFSKRELVSFIPILISILGVLLSYVLLRFGKIWSGEFFGKTYIETVCLYKQVFPYILLLVLFLWNGTRLATFYNYFAHRAYNLSLLESVAGNVNILNQIIYVKERSKKIESYKCSVIGGLIGFILLTTYNYFSYSSFQICTFVFMISCIMIVIPLLYIYHMNALYFPVFEALRHNKFKIDLYNADHNGGLDKTHNFLFKTFIYNEGLIFIIFWFCLEFYNVWILLVFFLLVIMRANHAGLSLRLYLLSLRDFYRAKKDEKERLFLQNDDIAFDKIEKLKKLYGIKFVKYVLNISIVVVLPYLINNADSIVKWIGGIIPVVWNIIAIN